MESVFEKGWMESSKELVYRSEHPQCSDAMWDSVRALRSEINKCIEQARRDKVIGSSSECQVVLHVSTGNAQSTLVDYLSKLLSVDAIGSAFSDSSSSNSGNTIYLHSNSQMDNEFNNKLKLKLKQFACEADTDTTPTTTTPTTTTATAVPHYGTDDLRYVLKVSQVRLLVDNDTSHICSSLDNINYIQALCPDYNTTVPIHVTGIGGVGAGGIGTVTIGVSRADGKLCERCWLYCHSVGEMGTSGADDVCHRCNSCI